MLIKLLQRFALTGLVTGLLSFLPLYLLSQYFELSSVIRDNRAQQRQPLDGRLAVTQVLGPASANDNLVSHSDAQQLLALEYHLGLSRPSEYSVAQNILASASVTLQKNLSVAKLDNADQAQKFFNQASKYFSQHYRYKASTSFTQGLLSGQLDCDLRVLVMLDMAQRLGLDNLYYVKAPGHVFIGWQQPQNTTAKKAPLLWETTTGLKADLSNTALYKPATTTIYGDYQLASAKGPLVQSQLLGHTAWQLYYRGQKHQAADLFDRANAVQASANFQAAVSLARGQDFSAYKNYASTYPEAIHSQLYRLWQTTQATGTLNTDLLNSLLEQGLQHWQLTELIHAHGSTWQIIDGLWLQAGAARLGQALYPSQPFVRSRQATAEGRFIIQSWLSLWLALWLLGPPVLWLVRYFVRGDRYLEK